MIEPPRRADPWRARRRREAVASILSAAAAFGAFVGVATIGAAMLLPTPTATTVPRVHGPHVVARVPPGGLPPGGWSVTSPPVARGADPSPTPDPLASATPATLSPPPAAAHAEATVGSTAPILVDGRRVGRVMVRNLRHRQGSSAASRPRMLVATVRLVAVEPLTYDAADWVAIDATGRSWPSRGAAAPGRALGSGRLASGDRVSGTVAFTVPRGVTIRALVLRDATGRDLVTITRRTGS